jgi:multisubunit Na+/H+ antiporter MnhB subunit
MFQTGYYLLFIPGLAVVAVAVGFVFLAFAFNQGEFQPGTKRGLFSLVVVVLFISILGVLAFQMDHLNLPRPGA